jgi:hypothetical protein
MERRDFLLIVNADVLSHCTGMAALRAHRIRGRFSNSKRTSQSMYRKNMIPVERGPDWADPRLSAHTFYVPENPWSRVAEPPVAAK